MTKQELINIAISYVINIQDQAGNKLDVIEFDDVEKIIDELILKQDQAKRKVIADFLNWYDKLYKFSPPLEIWINNIEYYLQNYFENQKNEEQ